MGRLDGVVVGGIRSLLVNSAALAAPQRALVQRQVSPTACPGANHTLRPSRSNMVRVLAVGKQRTCPVSFDRTEIPASSTRSISVCYQGLTAAPFSSRVFCCHAAPYHADTPFSWIRNADQSLACGINRLGRRAPRFGQRAYIGPLIAARRNRRTWRQHWIRAPNTPVVFPSFLVHTSIS